MTTHTFAQGARSASILTAGTLAAATYIAGSVIDLGAAIPVDLTFEVEANANGTPSGNKQLKFFLKLSLDNTNFTTGPESGTTVTEEADLHYVGALPMNDTNDHRRMFRARGLPIARYIKPVLFNDLGVALTSGAVYYAVITPTTTA